LRRGDTYLTSPMGARFARCSGIRQDAVGEATLHGDDSRELVESRRSNATHSLGPCSSASARDPVGADRRIRRQRDLTLTANTYTQVMLEEGEVDYANLLA
jgi:hypothetical protein